MLYRLMAKIETNRYVSILRRGFMLAVPFLMIGAFALVFYALPIAPYQTFLHSFLNGALADIFFLVQQYTLGSLTLIIVVTMALSYQQAMDRRKPGFYIATALVSYCVFTGDPATVLSFEVFGSTWLLTGIVITLLSCGMLHGLLLLGSKHKIYRQQLDDQQFVSHWYTLLAMIVVVLFFCLLRAGLTSFAGGNHVQNLFAYLSENLFANIGRNYGSAVLFMVVCHVMWMFGIHGNNVLDNVAVNLFEGGMEINVANLAAGLPATEIFTKTFFDVFVFMGGCGAAICIVIAILIGSRDKARRSLARAAVFPGIFNISEIMIFGLPVIFNPIMFIPFILVPVVLLTTSTVAVALGWVPIAVETVGWTTPPLWSGFLATGSVAGSILQVVNIIIGTLIYLPFIRSFDKPAAKLIQNNIKELEAIVLENESMGMSVKLTEGVEQRNLAAKRLLSDLYVGMQNGQLKLHYQPQVDYEGRVIGAEGLLRWAHPFGGYVIPPLIISLAKEDDYLDEMGLKIIEWAAADLDRMVKGGVKNFKLSINISSRQLEEPDFCKHVAEIVEKYKFGSCTFAFEITEQDVLRITPYVQNAIRELGRMGIDIIMDDFGMGHTSMLHMQDQRFSYVKLDGSLVKDMLKNERSGSIIEAVCQLGERLNFRVIAEFVERKEEREHLHKLGCNIYQGFLYSPAVPFDDFMKGLADNSLANPPALAENNSVEA